MKYQNFKCQFLLFLISCILVNNAFSQQAFADTVRKMIETSVTNLHVAPIEVKNVKNTFVIDDNDTIFIRIYYPEEEGKLPVIYQIHGGALVAGDLNTHDNICRVLCKETNSIVVAVDYRRAPEYPYPAAIDDAFIVLKWISLNMKSLNGNGKIILIGDSGGAGFVAAVCLKNIAADHPIPILAEVLVDPALDLRTSAPGYKTYADFVQMYLPDSSKANESFASPIVSNYLNKLPPTYIVVCEKDELIEDGLLFYNKLKSAGVQTALFEQKGTGHYSEYWCAAHPLVKPGLDFVIEKINRTIADSK